MTKNTTSGKQGETEINTIIEDYLTENLGKNDGLIDDFDRLKFDKDCFYFDVPPPHKKLINGSIKKDGYYLIHSITGHSLLIVNENKHKLSKTNSGSNLDSYENELVNKLPRTIKHLKDQGIASLVVGLFSVTGLRRIKNWNWNEEELAQHLYDNKIWFNRQPGKANIHAELDDIFEYYATEIDWENRQQMPMDLKVHLGVE